MMAIDKKRLSEAGRCWVDTSTGEVIDITHAWQESDRRIAISRRQRALLAAAGEVGPAARWYVLHVKPGQDNAVDKLLEAAKIERWMAQETRIVRRRGRFGTMRPVARSVPFLPGYLFIKVVWCAACWQAISGLKGVVSVIGGAEKPVPVSEAKMLKLRADVEHDPEAIKEMMRSFRPGDKVCIDEGSFASFPAVFEAVNDRGRAVIEVMIFGRSVSVDLDLAQISKL